ncbi:MAG: hypothetical protein M3Z25_01280 [Actinomycetota bacterium]|nr:hypothetical protein [Actinomycetota bacterium]
MTVLSTPLIRFVTDGLLATIESHRTGALPLHRFAWELRSRIDTLAELTSTSTTVTRLRWLQRSVQNLHTALAATGRAKLSDDEQDHLTATLTSLHTALTNLIPHRPLDPAGADNPATVRGMTS